MTRRICPLCEEPYDHQLDDFEVASIRYAHKIKFEGRQYFKYCHHVRDINRPIEDRANYDCQSGTADQATGRLDPKSAR